MFQSIRYKLITSSMILLLVVITILSGLLYSYEYDALEEMAVGRSMEVNRLQAEFIGKVLEGHMKQLVDLAQNENAMDLDMEMIMTRLKGLMENDNFVYFNAFYLDADGHYTTPSGETGFANDRAYFQKLANTDIDYIISDPVTGRSKGIQSVVFAAKIPSNTGFKGALCGTVEIEKLSSIIDGNLLKDISYGWIINQDGIVVVHPEAKYSMKAKMAEASSFGVVGMEVLWEKVQVTPHGFGEYYDSNIEQEKILTYYDIPSSPGWKLMITTIKSEVYTPMVVLKYKLIYISIVVALVSSVVIWIFASRLVKPLITLTETVRSSKESGIVLIEEIDSKDEIGTLIEAYNDMGRSLMGYTNNLEAMVEERTEKLNQLNEILSRQNDSLEEKNEALYTLATTDKLTGLLNRMHIYMHLEREIDRIRIGKSTGFALLFLDLDNFKFYNDTFGHDIGDEILKEISDQFKSCLRATDIIGRYGGDEFIVIIPECTSIQAKNIAQKIENVFIELNGFREKLSSELDRLGVEIMDSNMLGVSIGITHYDSESKMSMDELIKLADSRMYEVKRARKS